MRNQYNSVALDEGWEKLPTDVDIGGNSLIECTVYAMLDRTYGKMPDSGAKQQVIMEFAYYAHMLANTTTWNETIVPQATQTQFKSWMLSEKDLSYQYANMIAANMPSPRYKAYENSNF